MAALTAGVVVRSMTDGAAEPSVLDIDVVSPVVSPLEAPPSTTGAEHNVGKEPPLRRSLPMRRAKTNPAHDTAAVPGSVMSAAPVKTDEPARFALSAGVVATRPGAASAGSASGPPRSGSEGDTGASGEGDVDVPARLLSSSPLVYPPVARQAEIEIDLPVEIVVDAEGRVATARAVSRAGYGLDEAALRAIREYRFSPALRAGRPVRARMRWIVQFRLR
jgi:TonB family protein